MMIIDGHCHAGPGDGFTGPWDTRASLTSYLARAAAAGIERTVVFAPFTSDCRQANRVTAGIVAADPARLWGYAFVHAQRDAGHVHEMLSEARQLGLVGVKVHRHDGPMTRELASVAAEFGWPVLYDVQGAVASVDLLAAEFPGVSWIVPHLGSFSDDWWAQRCVVEMIVRHPNVYADTSGVRRFDILAEAADRAPGKLIFGTDGPDLHPGLELAKIHALNLSDTDRRAVLGGTLERILRPHPGSATALPSTTAAPDRVRSR